VVLRMNRRRELWRFSTAWRMMELSRPTYGPSRRSMASRRPSAVEGFAVRTACALPVSSIGCQSRLTRRRRVECGPPPHLAEHHGLTAYDAAYQELAIRLRLPLATSDTALISAAAEAGVQLLL
jgi:hypothetical protein